MNKKVWIVGLILGLFLILATVILAWIATSQANIIGGAGWPTFCLYLSGYAVLAQIGTIVSVVSLVFLLRRK